MTRLLAAALLLSSAYETYRALPALAVQMPNRAALGLSATVWITFAIEVFLCAIFLLVPWLARIAPGMIHFGARRLSDYTPSQLERALPVVRRMMGALCVLVTFFMGLGVHLRIQQARSGSTSVAPLLWVNGAMVVCLIGVTVIYGQQMDNEAGEP